MPKKHQNSVIGKEYIEGKIMSTTTNATEPSKTWVDDLFGPITDEPPTRGEAAKPCPKPRAERRRFNLAIWRLMTGVGSPSEEIGVLTGLSVRAVEDRRWRVESEATEAEKNPSQAVYTDAERKYLLKRYGHVNDPETKSFVQDVLRSGRSPRFDPERN